jgi:hypothetical protein
MVIIGHRSRPTNVARVAIYFKCDEARRAQMPIRLDHVLLDLDSSTEAGA